MKIILGFLIFIVWAVGLYSLVRKFKKGWHILLIIASIFSLATLIMKGVVAGALPVEIIAAYIAGIIFGAALLSLVFTLKSRQFMITPKTDFFARNYNFKGDIHLRHLLQMGILLEEEGMDFYKRLAERYTDLNVRNLCTRLANDEISHRQFIENILSRWLLLPMSDSLLDLLGESVKARGIFLNPPPMDSKKEDMIRYAIEQEEKMADFYLQFEAAFPDAWKRTHVQQLAIQERGHAEQLREYMR